MTLSNEQVEIKEEASKVEENTSDLVDSSSYADVSAKAPNLLTFLQNSLIPLTVSNVDVDMEAQQASEVAHNSSDTAGSVKKYMDSTMFLNLIRQSDTAAKAKHCDHIEQENEYCDLVLNELTQIMPVPVSDSNISTNLRSGSSRI